MSHQDRTNRHRLKEQQQLSQERPIRSTMWLKYPRLHSEPVKPKQTFLPKPDEGEFPSQH